MLLLILLISLNVLLAVIFKLFNNFGVDNLEAIVSNYFTCATMACLLTGRVIIDVNSIYEPWFPYALFLGTLFIFAFNLAAVSFQKIGLIVTSIFQKMSLIIPTLLGILVFSELASWPKVIGILMAIGAILLINSNIKQEKSKLDSRYIFIPVIIFITSGIIESTLYFVQKTGVLSNANIEFVGAIFLIAGIIGLPLVIFRNKRNRLKNIMAGIILGIPNFFTIYYLLELIDRGWEASSIFPILNVSILALAALLGVILFSEKLNPLRIIGFALAICSIYLVSL